MIESIAQQIQDGVDSKKLMVCLGTFSHAPGLKDMQGVPVGVEFDGEHIDVEILPFKGSILNKMLESDVPIHATPAGHGSVKQDEDGTAVIQDDYDLDYISFVNDPA